MTDRTLRQPMPCPQSYAEYERARPHMIDTAGRPSNSPGAAPATANTSPSNPTPPMCPAPAARPPQGRCTRPSGHEADAWHKDRLDAFYALCDALESAGYPQVARWP